MAQDDSQPTMTENPTVRMDARAEVQLTTAMRNAIDRIALTRQMSRADIMRQAMLTGLPDVFPEFVGFYREELGKNG